MESLDALYYENVFDENVDDVFEELKDTIEVPREEEEIPLKKVKEEEGNSIIAPPIDFNTGNGYQPQPSNYPFFSQPFFNRPPEPELYPDNMMMNFFTNGAYPNSYGYAPIQTYSFDGDVMDREKYIRENMEKFEGNNITGRKRDREAELLDELPPRKKRKLDVEPQGVFKDPQPVITTPSMEPTDEKVGKKKGKRKKRNIDLEPRESGEALVRSQHEMVRQLMLNHPEYQEIVNGPIKAELIQGKGNGNFKLKKIRGEDGVVGMMFRSFRTAWQKKYILNIYGLHGCRKDYELGFNVIESKFPYQEWPGYNKVNNIDGPELMKDSKIKNVERHLNTEFRGVARFHLKPKYNFQILKKDKSGRDESGKKIEITKDSCMFLMSFEVQGKNETLAFPFIGTSYEDGGKDRKNKVKIVLNFPLLCYRKN